MVEEPGDQLRRIERHVLVYGVRGQAWADRTRRGDRARGQQNGEAGPPFAERCDQRQYRVCLTHARRMHPDQRPLRSRQPGAAETFALAAWILFAAPLPHTQNEACRWPCDARQGAVGGQFKCTRWRGYPGGAKPSPLPRHVGTVRLARHRRGYPVSAACRGHFGTAANLNTWTCRIHCRIGQLSARSD